MTRIKLLLVSCHFPPAGGISVQRALGLAKYLPRNDFEVHVLTTRNPAVAVYEPGLIRQVPDCVGIHRALTLEPPFRLRKMLWHGLNGGPAARSAVSNGSKAPTVKAGVLRHLKRFICPDPQVLWRPFALRSAARIVEREGINVVLVTAPPFSSFLIGNALKARYPHIHLISDFRDEWLSYFLNEFAYKGDHYVRERSAEIERATVAASDRVVAVTPAALDTLKSRYSDQAAEKFRLIPNGYDPEMFETFRPRAHNSSKIVITYVGTVYGPSSPVNFLDILDRLPGDLASRFEVRFVGRVTEELGRGILDNRKASIKSIGFVPQQEAIRYMEETDYLLLPWSDHLNIPGKVYEYLATRKPILGLVRGGSDADRILRQSGIALLADHSDPTGIQRLLERLCEPAGLDALHPNWPAIQRYERPRLAAEYAELVRECVDSRQVVKSGSAVA